MTLDPNIIAQRIEDNFGRVELEIEDTRGDGEHFILSVKSDRFDGMPRIEQHRMVYKALADIPEDDLAALHIKTIS